MCLILERLRYCQCQLVIGSSWNLAGFKTPKIKQKPLRFHSWILLVSEYNDWLWYTCIRWELRIAADALAPYISKPSTTMELPACKICLVCLHQWGLTRSMITKRPFSQHGLTLIPAWISNSIHYKVWNKTISPFPNFNGAAIEVWGWISNFISHFIGRVIIYPCCNSR